MILPCDTLDDMVYVEGNKQRIPIAKIRYKDTEDVKFCINCIHSRKLVCTKYGIKFKAHHHGATVCQHYQKTN